MVDLAVVFTNYFVAFGVLFLTFVKILLVVGFSGFILKGLAELLM